MDLFVRHGQLEHQVRAGSLNDAAASPNTLSAAAICWQNNALESYSSQGPTIDGRIKPDIAGQDKFHPKAKKGVIAQSRRPGTRHAQRQGQPHPQQGHAQEVATPLALSFAAAAL